MNNVSIKEKNSRHTIKYVCIAIVHYLFVNVAATQLMLLGT